MPAFISKMAELTFKYLRGELNDQETQELDQVINEKEANKELFESLIDVNRINQELKQLNEQDPTPIWRKIVASGVLGTAYADLSTKPAVLAMAPEVQTTRKIKWIRYAAAAVVLIIAGLAGYYLWQQPTRQQQAKEAETSIPEDKTPITHGRVRLVIQGNKTIILDTVKNGVVTEVGNIQVIRSGNRLTYVKLQRGNDTALHTLVVDKGGNFQVTLSDGTDIWLNAESSIRYPAGFSGTGRSVELTGEGYFQVAKNSSQPFNVSVNNLAIEVLGTEFNLKAYKDEKSELPIITTIFEGSVEAKAGNTSKTFVKGQQIEVTSNGTIKVIKNPSLDKVIAWKNGEFHYKNDKLTTILSELGRWYDVGVQYKRNVQYERRTGIFPRTEPLDSILKRLSIPAGLNLKLNKDTIVVQ